MVFSRSIVGEGRKLNVTALSALEWNYLRGLFLADGHSYVDKRVAKRMQGRRRRAYVVKYSLQGNEEQLARNIAAMLKRTELNSRVEKCSKRYEWDVYVFSKQLLYFLPDKKSLVDVETRKRFFEENRLFTLEEGMPFLAGLLDGDGSFGPYVKKAPFNRLDPWRWEFAQSKCGMTFLVEYIEKFVESLVSNSVIVRVKRGIGGIVDGRKLPAADLVSVRIRKSGILGLLEAGVARYSWKADRWLKATAEFRSERESYYSTGEAARMLGVSRATVVRWLNASRISYVRRRGSGNSKGLCFRYIPANEFQKFKKGF